MSRFLQITSETGILNPESSEKMENLVKEPKTAILRAAAELIIKRGGKEIDISELANQAGVKRASIYATFGGRRESVRAVIYRGIVEEFLKVAGESIMLGLAVVDQLSPSPGEKLAAILRATLIAFKENQVFGKVVLQELNLKDPEESTFVRPIFKRVDEVIRHARKAGQLSEAAPEEDWELRQILFVLTRGLLRTLYLDQYDFQGKPFDRPPLTEKDVEIHILRVLKLYCREDSQDRIDKMVAALDDKRKQLTSDKKNR